MRFGPEQAAGESLSSIRYRRASYCWPWAWFSAPVLLASIYALRMGLGDGALGMSVVFISFLAGATLGIAALGAVGLSLGAAWARLCESSTTVANGWHRLRFVLRTVFLLQLWLFACYWAGIAITQQRILAGRRLSRIVGLKDDPAAFLISLTLFTILVIALPAFWMDEARKQRWRRKRPTAIGTIDRLPFADEKQLPPALDEPRRLPRDFE